MVHRADNLADRTYDALGIAEAFRRAFECGPGWDKRHYLAMGIEALDRRLAELKTEATDEELADLERRMIAAAERTASIELRFDRAPGGPAATEVALVRDPMSDEDALILPWSEPDTLQTRLTPGTWTARVTLSDGAVASETFTVEAAGASVQVVIASPPPPPLETPPPPATVSVRFGPPLALRRGVEATWEGPEAQPETTVREPEARWSLPAGRWVLHARARGFIPLRHELELRGASHQELDLRLRRDPAESARLGLSIGLGGAALGLVVGGAAVSGRAANARSAAFDDLVAGPSRDTRAAYVRTMKPLNQGIGALTGGLGVGVVAATVAGGGRRTPLLVELGLGGALAIGGLGGLYGVTRSGLQREPDPAAFRDAAIARNRRFAAMYGLLGAGLGMASAALTATLTQALLERRKGRSTARRHQPNARAIVAKPRRVE